MNTNSRQDSKVKKGAIRWLVRETLGNLVLIAILFGIVGRWDWWMGWALSGMYIIWSASIALLHPLTGARVASVPGAVTGM